MIFNGIDLSSILTVNEVKRPILAPQELTTIKLPGRSGEIVVRKQKKPIYIDVKITLQNKSKKEFLSDVLLLADILDTDDLLSELIFSDQPEMFYMAELDGSTDFDVINSFGKGVITFFVPDPYKYAVEDDVIIHNEAGEYIFERKGTAPSFPLIEIKGTNTSGSITIENESTAMKYTGQLSENETLFLDTELISAYVEDDSGEKTPVMDKLDNLEFPVLKKGVNHFSVKTNGGATISNVKITCRSRWK